VASGRLLAVAGLEPLVHEAISRRLTDSKRSSLSPASVWFVIALNVAWVVASVLLLLSSQIHPNALGYGFVIVQAIAVAAFAEMQYVGLRRRAA
jgi:hypothetical protein